MKVQKKDVTEAVKRGFSNFLQEQKRANKLKKELKSLFKEELILKEQNEMIISSIMKILAGSGMPSSKAEMVANQIMGVIAASTGGEEHA